MQQFVPSFSKIVAEDLRQMGEPVAPMFVRAMFYSVA
jgi:hypothetical protein